MKEIQLSQYGQASVEPAAFSRMMAEFAESFRDGVDVNLGVGYVNEDTIPATQIVEAMREVLARPDVYRQALNYGGPSGSGNLVRSLRGYLLKRGIPGLDEPTLRKQRIIIGLSGATSILDAIGHVLPRGLAVVADPSYYIYTNYLQRRGFGLLSVPEDHHGVDPQRLAAKLDALGSRAGEVQFFYFVTVSNPTCSILSDDRRKGIIAVATRLSEKLGRKVPVFFDRAYEDLVHDPAPSLPATGLACDPLGIVHEIGTVSKVLAPALRIGYMMGKPSAFMRVMVQRTSDAGFSAPLILQEVVSYLLDHEIQRQLDTVNAEYQRKAGRVRAWIDEHLGEYLQDCAGGQAGFYYYLTFRDIDTSIGSRFYRFLARSTGEPAVDGPAGEAHPRVVYIPGQICVDPDGDLAETGRRQLRINYGFESLERIGQAIELMAQAARYALHR